jgi:hypothetical protein
MRNEPLGPFIAAMKAYGLTASSAIRGLRLLTIRSMATPELLSRPCAICIVRKRAEPNPSVWIYRPFISDPRIAGGNNPRITACDYHTACAIHTYMGAG